MYDLKKDHVINLPTISGAESASTSRKSLRRYWNQLPRCQRNLIIIGIAAICIMLLLFLPGEQIVSESAKEYHINIAPFKEDHEISNHHHQQSQQQQQPQQQPPPPQYQKQSQSHSRVQPKFEQQQQQPVPVINNEPPETTQSAAESNHNGISGANNENQFDEAFNQIEPQLQINNNINNINPNEIRANDINNNNQFNSNNKQNANNGVEEFVNRLEEDSENNRKDFKGPSNDRQRAVVEAFRHSWKGYKEFAWGHDNLKPISMGTHDWFGLGLTIVDALDTMYIMDLQDDFEEARNWVEAYLQLDVNKDVNLFEVTIRVLGGLLSAYHLSGDKMFLSKSNDLGNRLLACFNSPSGIPYSDVNLATMRAHSPKWSPDSSTSEVTTIQLEFRDLARCTGNKQFEEVVERVNEKVHSLEKTNGLVPIFINANTGMFRSFATISLGARGDSYYEYLLKQWLQTGKRENDFLIEDYMAAIDGVMTQLVRKTPNEHHTYIGELINGKDFKPKMDHLTCYLPGTLLLGHRNGMPDSHIHLANELLETCYQTYMKQPTGLAPEITYFNLQDETDTDIHVKSNDAHNLLRPEFIESLYYFYVLTGNRTYQDMGWNIFQSFEKYTKVKNGYTSIGNVKNPLNTRPRDMMESFWLGETLKYFYLLFSDDRSEIDLEKYIFNTEAHPLPIRNY